MNNSRQQGFVLVFTLWTLVALTLAIGYFADWTETATLRAQQAEEELYAEIDRLSTLAILQYVMTSRLATPEGLGNTEPTYPIRRASVPVEENGRSATFSAVDLTLNGRVFRGYGGARFALQDEAGLIPLYNCRRLAKLLAHLTEGEIAGDSFCNRLQDYVDPDETFRINGAESADYLAAGKSPPPNQPLLSSWETKQILGWAEQPVFWANGTLPRLTTANFIQHYNPFTSPIEIMLSQGILTESQAEALTKTTIESGSGSSMETLAQMIPELLNGSEDFASIPSRYVRLTLMHDKSPTLQEIEIEMSPDILPARPWRVQSALTIPNNLTNGSTALPSTQLNGPIGLLFDRMPGFDSTSEDDS